MYRYDEFDAQLVRDRVKEFSWQVKRRLNGDLTEDEFKPLRLMNGLYLQLHAYMLRVAIPYGTLSSRQLRKLAHIARTYDKGYGHFTTRQNIQFNWPKLEDVPAILGALAEVEMHCIQTSGNCIRNVTADHFAGVAADEVADPRPLSEIIRQWSTLHPEFSFLPRKFKIAITGAPNDRAAIRWHDIGIQLVAGPDGAPRAKIFAGGGQGRTPMIAPLIKDALPLSQVLSYLTAIMRVYNRHGRRDNIYKARIKILVHALGAEDFTRQVEEEFAAMSANAANAANEPSPDIPAREHARIAAYFAAPQYETLEDSPPALSEARAKDPAFDAWVAQNMTPHRQPGYAAATLSLKPLGGVPGDANADQMEVIADLAERYSFDELRVTHEQNLVLPHLRQEDLYTVWQALAAAGLAAANAGQVTDIICCPGLDYCNLANARSIPIAQAIQERFTDAERAKVIGELKIKISGCINACGHHHAGHIGILGVDKKGVEYYQISLGGSGAEDASLGDITGPAFGEDEVPGAIEKIVDTYMTLRSGENEPFLATYRRVGLTPFKEALYGAH